jgi:hypothetical protein
VIALVCAHQVHTPGICLGVLRQDAWTPIRYPHAVWDDEGQCWISDAEVAQIGFTAFTSRRKTDHITARLIVRRVKRLNSTSVPAGQSELFAAYRHHAVFTNSPQPMLQAETTHRQHAIIEQVNADLKAGPLAHLSSGSFAANSAWLCWPRSRSTSPAPLAPWPRPSTRRQRPPPSAPS